MSLQAEGSEETSNPFNGYGGRAVCAFRTPYALLASVLRLLTWSPELPGACV